MLLNKANSELNDEEYILKFSFMYLQMKKVSDSKIEDIRNKEENATAMKNFLSRANFLFVKQLAPENLSYSTDAPNLEKEGKGKKFLIVVKTNATRTVETPFPDGIQKDVVFMELNKPVLDNLYAVCQGVFLPVLGNPLNQVGWSDLVSKDLMDKFHSFLAYTVVTIGLVQGQTVLPLPQSDVTSSDRTSSKDKSIVLENAIIQWSRQIKHVLKQDPETALKMGNHPDPSVELEFWRNKSENLNSICLQLNSERVKKVLKFLEQNKSTYTSTFSKLQKEVQAARTEANENYKYLQTLGELFKKLTDPSVELEEVASLFVPTMHTILMIWTYSPYYNTPARLVVLIREICNAIITQCQNFVSRDRIFEAISAENPAEAHQCLATCIDVCARFKEAYFDYKAKSKNQWKITTNALFVRLDAFSERCQDIMHLTGTIMQFNKLQKIEIGNTKGKTMTQSITRIFEEFNAAVETFTGVKFDIMDIECREFEDDFFKFRQAIKALERRLASVVTQSFDDCDTIIGKFKLLESFEGLLNRQIIQDEVEKKHVTLLELYKHDLKTVSNIFHEGRLLVENVDERAPIGLNMPPVAGALNWTAGLLERVREPFEKLDTLSSSIRDREEYKDVQKLYTSLCRNLKEFEDTKITQWCAGVEENTEPQLNKFLLVRDEPSEKCEEGFVRVNFDLILKALLREVKYLLLLDLDVPETASALYAGVDKFRHQTGQLELIVDMYNGMLEKLLPVEKPLFSDRIERMNKALQPGIDTLMWNSDGIIPYINQAMKIVTEVDVLVKKMKDNVAAIRSKMEDWRKPLFERKAKTADPEMVATIHNAAVEAERENIRSQGKDIHKLMKDTLDNIKPDKKGKAWLDYVDYVNGLVIEGITIAIDSSMKFMADQLNIKQNQVNMWSPIFEIKVDLEGGDLAFIPSIEANDRENGIRDIINAIVNDFISIAIQIPRLDSKDAATAGDFLVEIKDQFQLFGTLQEIALNLDEITVSSNKFLDQYRYCDFLWKNDVEQSFREFLNSGQDLREIYEAEQKLKNKRDDPEEEEALMKEAMTRYQFFEDKILKDVTTRQPDLAEFDKKIEFLHAVKNDISGMKESHNIGWLKVNTQNLIDKLLATCQTWIDKYTRHLVTNTEVEIENIKEFIDKVSKGIKQLPENCVTQAEKDQLMEVMIHLRDVRMVTGGALGTIEPLKQQITLLRKHGVQMKSSVDPLVELEMVKNAIKENSERALGAVKAKILPIQKNEAENIKEAVRNHRVKVEEFRKTFRENLPYHIAETAHDVPKYYCKNYKDRPEQIQDMDEASFKKNCVFEDDGKGGRVMYVTREISPIQQSYDKIGAYHIQTMEMQVESERLRNLEGLFDLTESKFKQIEECKADLVNLKKNWDLISLIDSQFDAWKKTLWDQIDTDNLTTSCREMASKQTNPQFNKDIKGYKSFQALNDRIKNMSKLLPLIGQLHSKYMQDRHWTRLMTTTCKKIDHKNPKFCLNDLLVLELHKFEADVEELVESAAKEDKIDNNIRKIIKEWDKMKFTFEEVAGVPCLGETGEIVELVEQHGMDIQGMLGQKDVAEFREVVSKWRGYMTTLENVIEKWRKVQGDWRILRPIFIESEDIKAQLPDAAATFQKVHEEFRELMFEVQEEPLVIPACTAEGRLEKLKYFETEIESCQKALNDQLESKQKIFPRFYFVSKEILLTILSNGGNPEKVNEFMGDCFDGMNFVTFQETEERPYRIVNGMEAKDGEKAPWHHTIKLEGAPEQYMLEVERGMQKTLIIDLENAKADVERWIPTDLPREIWLEYYNSQTVLLTTQIVWTEETISAFDEVEAGAEGAMKDNYMRIVERINKLIDRTLDLTLSAELRTKIIIVITVDVHGRDVVNEFVVKKTQDSSDFMWQKQLKFGMDKNPMRKDDPKQEHNYSVINICDWQTWFSYEYVGNIARLVITPLTDKCYVTLTQALNLLMGAAPAGPAGTGKTETTKDLGRALGLRVVVYNCSDQMNFKTLANIFMGLSQSGFWGCFDEFNRISIEVLSVCSSQVKNVLDALVAYRATNGQANKFIFMNADIQENINILPTVGFFITMNPGYAGRTELPENLKAQFRYCSMCVPDMILICENMLMSEGFKTAKSLANKFMTLYDLCKSLLSEQTHYDWGLRAVKSLLRQAGSLKRAAAADEDEDLILMKALRDFNIAKIVYADIDIFMNLIKTLFPGLVSEAAVNHELRASCAKVAMESGLQTDAGFILKNEQMADILGVRHSIFLIGGSGLGKSAVWKNLAKALSTPEQDHLTIWQQVDPKAVDENELVGWENLKTKEWRDGVLSSMFRNMNKCMGQFKKIHKYKWVVLDGDVDPNWIESMNTVMDDNKVLTLVSNERIPVTPSMRLIIEVSNLRNATPATVSRGGVLFINEADIGWQPYYESWRAQYKKGKTQDDIASTHYTLCLTQYINDSFLESLHMSYDPITPMVDIAYIMSLTTAIDYQMGAMYATKKSAEFHKNLRVDIDKNAENLERVKCMYDCFFAFAMIWSFGAPLDEAKRDFNGYLRSACRKLPFPEGGSVYDYYYDPIENRWVNWMEQVKPLDPALQEVNLFSTIIVGTAETERQKFLINMHKNVQKGILYVGIAGTGKTTIVNDYFADCDNPINDSDVLHTQCNFNNYTSSQTLQNVVEGKVEKRTGVLFGPPVGKTLIYFIDDLNMPIVDVYFTQQPIALVRQLIDYGTMYNRNDLSIQQRITDCMFICCMNPKSGSFFVDVRCTRHLTTVCLSVPEKEILTTIYSQLLVNHFKEFDEKTQKKGPMIIQATQTVFADMSKNPKFAPTARKFFYQFNMRDFAKIVQNILTTQPKDYKGKETEVVRLWAHECHRVWRDRLITADDIDQYTKTMSTAMKGALLNGDIDEKVIFQEPLIYTSFVDACKGHDASYRGIKDIEELSGVLTDQLASYNENVAVLDLVLFLQAMEHITRTCRIIDQPSGHALLVGVGGSGKQSLSKLSAFILSIEVFRIVVSSSYGMNDLKEDIKVVFMKAGCAGNPQLFVLTDTQIINDKFLMYINDILSTGYIEGLFASDELDEVCGKVRSEARSNGVEDTPAALFDFFLSKIKKNLHLDLCFSPVGDAFRIRARMFAGIINNTTMDYHHAWPTDALVGVADRFLEEVDFDTPELRHTVSEHMAFCHNSIDEANARFLLSERRNNYVTPTSFLELIKFYKSLLNDKRGKIIEQIKRLEIGLQTMEDTNKVVADLSVELDETMVIVDAEKEATGKLIAVVDAEAADAAKEEAIAKEQEDATNIEAGNAQAVMDRATLALNEAIPLIKEAEEAVNCLNKPAIDELKSFGSPSAAVLLVVKAVLILYKNEKRNYAWDNGKKMMKDPNAFLAALKSFNKEEIPDWVVKEMDEILKDPSYNEATMKKGSSAAASLCVWSIAVMKYNKVYKFVKPLEDEAKAAKELADTKLAELKVVQDNVAAILAKVAELQAQLEEANAKKKKVEDQAEALNNKLDLANRLVGGLADENKRWNELVKTLGGDALKMIGNCVMSAAFVSYIGPFSQEFRDDLWRNQWLADVVKNKIPFTDGIDPLEILSNASIQAGWKTEGLPADRISMENGSIVTNCSRFPLMIDPQLQGQNWIQGREGGGMTKIQLSQKGWAKKVELAVSNGQVLMIENLSDKIDAVLDPLLSKNYTKKGKAQFVKLGNEDVEVHAQFKLYLQTKMQNPHYIPEVAAQCTIINFIVTEAGLEDQLLAEVVRIEKPDLEQQRDELVQQQNQSEITLAKLSDQLLQNLSDADPATILENFELIEGLETTKKTSTEIEKQQKEAIITGKIISESREVYRPVAAEGAMLYFLLIKMYIVDPMYQYSLESFSQFFYKAIGETLAEEDDKLKVQNLVSNIRMVVFRWIARGLFERHKQIFLSLLTFRLMQKGLLDEEYNAVQMNFLVNCPLDTSVPRPAVLKDWLPEVAWYSVQSLIKIDPFEPFANHLEKEMPRRFNEWYNELAPESCKLPGDWKALDKQPFQKMLVTRCLRPDRVTAQLSTFIRTTLPKGDQFVDCDNTSSADDILQTSFVDASPTVPVFFILSPGANPIKNVENLARKMGMDPVKQIYQVALGQGQDVVANAFLDMGHKEGQWVMLQNVHLMPAFLYGMLKRMDGYAQEGSHINFRVFLTSDPTNSIPIELLQRSIKLTNEPPAGFKANMSRAFVSFKKEDFDEKDSKIKTILFGLVYFHTVMSERKKFGPKGFNMVYPFSEGDLRCSSIILQNYMDSGSAAGKIPWNDLKYLVGEIMYGGHIVNGFDLIICMAYLDGLLNDTILDEAELFPFAEGRVSFKCPVAASYEKYQEHIETELPPETPLAFGLHPNAEISFLTTQCNNLFGILVELQPKDGGGDSAGVMSTTEIAQAFSVRIFDEVQIETKKLPLDELKQRLIDDTRGPYQNVYLQECELINTLINVIVNELKDLELAFKGELTMTNNMEKTMNAIELNRIPVEWSKKSWKTSRSLSSWVDNLGQRLEQLNIWKDEPGTIHRQVCFLNRLYKPNSFLTAIKQVCAMKTNQGLNKLYIQTDVQKRFHWEPEMIQTVSKSDEGCYVFGFQLEGAAWDKNAAVIEESLPKQMFSTIPVVWCKAMMIVEGKEEKGIFPCPVYMTTGRFTTYVCMAQLKTRHPFQKWILAGAALILDVEGVSDAYYPGQKPPEDAEQKK